MSDQTVLDPDYPMPHMRRELQSTKQGVSMASSARRMSRRKDTAEYRLVFVTCFAVFLVAAIISRLLPWHWLTPAERGKRQSIIVEARDAANTALPYAFMS
jgi:hypothetical protein